MRSIEREVRRPTITKSLSREPMRVHVQCEPPRARSAAELAEWIADHALIALDRTRVEPPRDEAYAATSWEIRNGRPGYAIARNLQPGQHRSANGTAACTITMGWLVGAILIADPQRCAGHETLSGADRALSLAWEALTQARWASAVGYLWAGRDDMNARTRMRRVAACPPIRNRRRPGKSPRTESRARAALHEAMDPTTRQCLRRAEAMEADAHAGAEFWLVPLMAQAHTRSISWRECIEAVERIRTTCEQAKL